MRPLSDDTLADKLVRFVIGALLGAGIAFFWIEWGSAADDAGLLRALAIWSIAGGALAVVFGNRFIEGVFQDRWWKWW